MMKENINEGNDLILCSTFADYSTLDLIPLSYGKVIDLQLSHSACPFCNWRFKSPGAFANHLKNIHTC